MAAADDDDLTVPPGYSFCPADKELTDIYLRGKISASDEFAARFEARFFHDADVYSAEPEKLVQPFSPAPGTGTSDKSPPVWYFFSPVRYASKKKKSGRRSRTIDGDGGKKWHTEESQQPLKEGGSAFGGYVQRFSYVVKAKAKASEGKKEEDEKKRAGWIMAEYGISPEHGGGSLVLCKVYPSTYSHKTAAEDSPGINLRKRKAAPGDHPEAPTTTRPRTESETYYGNLDAVANDDVNMCPITRWVTSEQEAAEGAHLPVYFDFEQGTTDCFGIDEPAPEPASDHPEAPTTSAQPLILTSDADDMAKWDNIYSELLEQEGTTAADQGTTEPQPETVAAGTGLDHQPFSFWQEMEQEFEALYPISNSVMVDGSGGDLATPPCAQAAQPEEDAAGLVQTISDQDQNNDGSLTTTQLDEAADANVIYGLPCPDFSPEMLRKCMDDTTPWPSPTSLSLLLST